MPQDPKSYLVQELPGITDPGLILMFWKNYLEEKGLVEFSEPNKEVH